MLKIVVASENPVKIKASQMGFLAMFPHEKLEIKGIAAKSGVGKQPMIPLIISILMIWPSLIFPSFNRQRGQLQLDYRNHYFRLG